MIRFYRSVHPIYAITIDLDDTLYDNDPVILKAEEKLILFLKQYHPALLKIERKDYYIARKIIRTEYPEIYHNVNDWRWKSLEKILLKSGLSKHDACLGADLGMEIVMRWRNKINILNSTCNALKILNSRWPLIAITNGNADPFFFGLKKYFVEILRAGIHGRAKPYSDMYILASKFFDIPCKYILHIGDNLTTDVYGSMQAGMKSCWINQFCCVNYKNNLLILKKTFFPHLEISKLMLLTRLL